MQIKKELEIRKIAGESVLIIQGRIGLDMTKVISFNSTAEWLWNRFRGVEFSLDDAIRLLCERFQIDAATAEIDAKKWIEQLLHCNALTQ